MMEGDYSDASLLEEIIEDASDLPVFNPFKVGTITTLVGGNILVCKMVEGLLAVFKSPDHLALVGEFTRENFPPMLVVSYEPRSLDFNCAARVNIKEARIEKKLIWFWFIGWWKEERILDFSLTNFHGRPNNRLSASLTSFLPTFEKFFKSFH